MAGYKYRVTSFLVVPGSEPFPGSINYTNELAEIAHFLGCLEENSGVVKIVVDTSTEGGFHV